MTNRLQLATSPYLLQHQENPVDWQQWDEQALAEAAARDVPILLSVGYAACHWCHVMAHESFENEATARLMNHAFVNIKVDREERPDLDGIYQQALAVLGQQGGWPLTMFLTPKGEPFWGGTYFPPERRWGRPSFREVLERISTLWRDERDKIESNRQSLADSLARLARPQPGEVPAPSEIHRVAAAIADEIDPTHGGIGGAPKFPQAPALNLLWQAAISQGDISIRQRVVHTLNRICQGGIYDHLGGGFARYSVDAQWLVPHFEKMLYDNAQILELLGEAWAATANPLFAERARETVSWLQREMMTEGAFAASLDADSEGEEGRFYVWSEAEIDSLLGLDGEAFKAAYDVAPEGNWDGSNVLSRSQEPGLPEPERAELLARCRMRLRLTREKRPRPGRDDKLLADWNGMMIAALARTGDRLGESGWVRLAITAFDEVIARMSDGDGLIHSWRAGRRLELGFLDDFAQMSRAALALHEVTGERHYRARAEAWMTRVDRDFADEHGGYYLAPAAADLIVRPRNAHDGPTASAAGTIAIESIRLYALTGDVCHEQRCRRILTAFGGEVARNPFAHATLLQAALTASATLQIVVMGPQDDPRQQALWQAAIRRPLATRVLSWRPTSEPELPALHPLAGKTMIDGLPTAYVCLGTTCLAPATTPDDLARRLDEVAHVPA